MKKDTQISEKDDKSKLDQKAEEQMIQEKVKILDQAFFALNFYPVATKEENMNEAREKIKEIYTKGNETIKQIVLYMIHENVAKVNELKVMQNFEYHKQKAPNLETAQIRANVYKGMFNYTASLEGIIELIKILGELPGTDAAKILTYHFSVFSGIEIESMHILRNAVIEALGDSAAPYALKCLLRYARYSDSEMLAQRIGASIIKWDEKLESMKLPKNEKDELKKSLSEVITQELGGKHYG
ncbi:MAG: hypothetical protein AABX38_00640 [Candidatus Micrarchaeota archaeon]